MTKMTNDNWIWKAMLILGIAGIIFMALVSISGGTFFKKHDILNYLVTFGISLLVSGACFCFGALMGFLFGIPRLSSAQQARGTVVQNDNMVQVSDWLTKILVGVGLTQIYAIPGYFRKLGNFLSPCFDVGDTGAAIAICLVLYFLILGFMACYLWTRFYFSEMLEKTITEDEPAKQPEDNVNKMVNTTVHNMTINPPDPTPHEPAFPAAPADAPAGTDPFQPEGNADADPENPPFNPADANEPEGSDPAAKP